MRFAVNTFIILALFCVTAINVSAQHSEKLNVFTSILPQKFFVEQIGGDLVNVEVLVGPGMSPHTFEPSPLQMSRLARSAMFFAVGVSFEKALVKRMESVCPQVKIVATDEGVLKRKMESHDDHGHSHSEECDHPAGATDPHIWLDPMLVKIQGNNIANALKEALPDQAQALDHRLEIFNNKLDEFTAKLQASMQPLQGQTMLVFHPAFGYFADRFGLKQMAIEIEGKEPSPRQLAKIIRKCRSENIKVMFVQQQFSSRATQTIADSIGGSVIRLDPLAEDYFSNLELISQTVFDGIEK